MLIIIIKEKSTKKTTHAIIMSPEESVKKQSAQKLTNRCIPGDDDCTRNDINFQKKVEDYLTNQHVPNYERGKKKRTIYSTFHTPMSKTKITGGPGETGDNQEVRSNFRKPSIVRKNPTVESQDKHHYSNVAEISPEERESQFSLESLFHGRFDSKAKQVVEKTVDDIVENWRKGDPNCSTSTSSCDSFIKANLGSNMMERQLQYKLDAPRNLVLEQECAESNFTKVITIHNPTTELYAFKVCCKYFTNCTDYTVNPKSGLLQPQESVPVEISVKEPENNLRRNARKETVEIKIFPSLWSTTGSSEEIEKCFEEVTTKYPNLVSTQTFEALIFWSKGVLKRNTDLYVPAKDDKAVYTHEQSNRTKRFLQGFKKQMYISNATLREVLYEIGLFRSSQTAVTLSCFCILCTSVVLYIQQDQLLIQQQEQKNSWLVSLLKGLYLK